MVVCPGRQLNVRIVTRTDLFSHPNCHKRDGEIALPITCLEDRGNCQVENGSVKNFVRHFVNHHLIDNGEEHSHNVPNSIFNPFVNRVTQDNDSFPAADQSSVMELSEIEDEKGSGASSDRDDIRAVGRDSG